MLTKTRKSFFMVLKIGMKGRKGFPIPIPLNVAQITLDSVADLLWFWESLMRPFKSITNKGDNYKTQIPLRELFSQSRALIHELRRHGRWRMVEVDDGKTKVYIEFY